MLNSDYNKNSKKNLLYISLPLLWQCETSYSSQKFYGEIVINYVLTKNFIA